MLRKQPFSFEEFKEIYSKVPRLCVDLVIKDKKGFLLTLREKNGYEGLWHFPGGTVYYREPVKEAVKRVAKEELGVDIIIQEFAGYIEYLSEEKERGFGYTLSLVFVCKLKNSDFDLDNQVAKVDFFPKPPTNTIEEQKAFLLKIVS